MLDTRCERHAARVGTTHADVVVVGLGYVGLPLALSYARAGLTVIGVDTNQSLVESLNAGRTSLIENHGGQTIEEILTESHASGHFLATTDVSSAVATTRNVIITVGMPVARGETIRTPLLTAVEAVAKDAQPGTLIVLRSTVIPGTTESVVLPLIESTGRVLGRDFHLAYSPERIAEGRAFEEFAHMPTLVAGCDLESRRRAVELLKQIVVADLIEVEDVRAAELSKVIENVQRDVNIAMVQVFARMCEAMDLNTSEVITLANSHKRVSLLSPGPGVGGFCLPNALYYLLPKARELGIDVSLLEQARQINSEMPSLIRDVTLDALGRKGRWAAGSKVAVIGLAMKDYNSDARLSPPIDVCELLRAAGCSVYAYDPAVPRTRPYHYDSLAECIDEAEVLVLLARQHGVILPTATELSAVMAPDPVVVDTRNWFKDPDAAKTGVGVWRI